jgi:Mrp family chromosome partitioning ATPase
VSPTSGFLVVQASASSAKTAAALANAFGHAEVTVSQNDARAQFKQAANVAHSEIRALTVDDQITREVYEDRYVRLSSLARTSSPATLLTPASAPSSPSSTSPIEDGALGLIVGLTLGILGAFLLDALDRRPRRNRELTEELGWPILAQIREQALGQVAFANGGRHSRRTALDREAFHILRRNLQLMKFGREPGLIAVTSALPEEGKSTVAAALAFSSALAGKRTLLVDCDLRRSALADRLGLESSPGLVEFLRGEATPAEVVQAIRQPLQLARNGGSANSDPNSQRPAFAFIPAGSASAHPTELLGSERFRSFLREVSEAYDTVVLDTAPLLPVVDTLELLTDMDATLVCLRATRTTRDDVQALKQAVQWLPDPQIGLVITGPPHSPARRFGYRAQAYSRD